MTTSTRPVPAKTGIAISNDEEPGTEGSYAGPVLALLDDRARTERILDRLEVTEDLTERAALARELAAIYAADIEQEQRAAAGGMPVCFLDQASATTGPQRP